MEKETTMVAEQPKPQENGKQPTHFALPVEVFNEILDRISRFPYFLKQQIEGIEELIKANVAGVSITKTNTDDKQDQTAPEGK